MYCLDAFKSLIKEKLKQKHGLCNPARLSVLTKTTLTSTRRAALRAPQYYSSALRATRRPLRSIKGPLTYAGFLMTHIENASGFFVVVAHFLCNRCPSVVLYPVLSLRDHSIQEQRATWLQSVCIY